MDNQEQPGGEAIPDKPSQAEGDVDDSPTTPEESGNPGSSPASDNQRIGDEHGKG